MTTIQPTAPDKLWTPANIVTLIRICLVPVFVLAILTALQNKFKAPSATNCSVPQSKLACGGNCSTCTGSSCMANHEILDTRKRQAEEEALAKKKAALAKKEAELKAATAKKED